MYAYKIIGNQLANINSYQKNIPQILYFSTKIFNNLGALNQS